MAETCEDTRKKFNLIFCGRRSVIPESILRCEFRKHRSGQRKLCYRAAEGCKFRVVMGDPKELVK